MQGSKHALHRQGDLPRHDRLRTMCDKSVSRAGAAGPRANTSLFWRGRVGSAARAAAIPP